MANVVPDLFHHLVFPERSGLCRGAVAPVPGVKRDVLIFPPREDYCPLLASNSHPDFSSMHSELVAPILRDAATLNL